MDELLQKDVARLTELMGEAERCVVLTGVRLGATEETEAKAAGSSWSDVVSLEVSFVFCKQFLFVASAGAAQFANIV